MAIVYSYPLNDNIKSSDELVGTTSINFNGQEKTVTRNFLLSDIGYFYINNNILQRSLTLTTNNSGGPATLDQNTGILNIPVYASTGGGGVTLVSAVSPITSNVSSTPTISTSMSTNKLIGRYSTGTGVMQEITLGTGLTLSSSGVLNSTGGGGGGGDSTIAYYGQYFSYITQTAVTNNIGIPMYFETPDIYNGITVEYNGSAIPANRNKITFANTGKYNLQFSAQFQNLANTPHDIYIWLRKNGVTNAADVTGSTGVVGLEARKNIADPYHTIVTWNFLLDVTAGDYYQIVWATTDITNVQIQFYNSTADHPSTASTLFTVTQQGISSAVTGMLYKYASLNYQTIPGQVFQASSAINSNIFSQGDVLRINAAILFIAQTVNIVQVRFFLNTLPVIAGGNLIGLYNIPVGSRYGPINRYFWYMPGALIGRNFSNSASVSSSTSIFQANSVPFNSATNYIIVEVTTTGSDLALISTFTVEKV